MARRFSAAAADKITTALGGVAVFGPATFAIVLRKNDAANSAYGGGNNAPAWALFFSGTGADTNVYFWNGSASTNAPAVTYASSEGWVLIAVTKASGTQAVRFHKYVYSTGAWKHGNGGTLANSPAPTTSNLIGNDASGSPYDGDIAQGAFWTSVLTDLQIESLATDLSKPNWDAYVKTATFFVLNPDPTVTVVDQTGNGANETSHSGTSATPDEFPLLNPTVPLLGARQRIRRFSRTPLRFGRTPDVLSGVTIVTTAVSSTVDFPWEANLALAASAAAPYEATRGLATSSSEPWEALLAVAKTLSDPWEANLGLAATRSDPWEANLGVRATSSEVWEGLQAIAATRSDPYEATAALAVSSSEPWEALLGLAATRSDPWEALLKLATTAAGPYEALLALTASRIDPWEANLAIAATRIDPWEAVLGLSATRSDPWEARGSTAGTAVFPYEALLALTRAALAGWEALWGIRSGYSEIDRFDVDEDPISNGGGWSGLNLFGDGNLKASGGVCVPESVGTWSSAIRSGTFGPDVQVSITAVTADEYWLYARGAHLDAGDATDTFYTAGFYANGTVELYRADAFTSWNLIATGSWSATAGRRLSLRCAGDTIAALQDGSVVASVTDTVYRRAGQVAIETQNGAMDNFEVLVFPSMPIDVLRGVAGSASGPWEARGSTAGTAVFPYDALLALTRSALAPWEASFATAATVAAAWEALLGLAATRSDPWEARGSTAGVAMFPYEALLALTRSAVAPWEASFTTAATAAAAWEALLGVARSTVLSYEAAGGVASTKALPWEAAGRLAATSTAPYESGLRLAASAAVPYEALVALAHTLSAPWEALLGLSRTGALPFEAVLKLAAASTLPWEAGMGMSAVTQTALLPVDVLAGISRAQSLSYEAAAKLSRLMLLPWEADAIAALVFIRLLDLLALRLRLRDQAALEVELGERGGLDVRLSDRRGEEGEATLRDDAGLVIRLSDGPADR